jgi:hypothetical protein
MGYLIPFLFLVYASASIERAVTIHRPSLIKAAFFPEEQGVPPAIDV